jgi:spermidine synthase
MALLLIATLSMRGGIFWQPGMLDRGILIYARQFDVRPELTVAEHYQDTDIVFFKEGNNASISVRKGENYLGLRTNGKVDASNREDMITQLMMAYLAGFYHPAPRSAMIIGYGAGVTVGGMTVFKELEEIECLEIEPAVVEAAPFFSEINRRSFEDPRVRIMYNDARNYMNITRKQYDIIISEPSNPWIAGVASLFTAEFYDRAAQVLKPDGVFAQWIQLYELHPEDLRMILREFQRKFPEVSVWNSGIGDLILIGTLQPQQLDLNRVSRVSLADPEIMRDFREYMHMSRPEGILAYYVMSTEDVRKFAQTERRNTDNHPLLEFNAPRQLYSETRSLNIDLLYDYKTELVPHGVRLGEPNSTYSAMIEPLLAMSRTNVANQVRDMLNEAEPRDEAALHIANARLSLSSDDFEDARISLEQAAKIIADRGDVSGENEELLGILYERTGAADDAISHFLRAAAADPQRALSLQKLAELYADNELWEEAAHWMERYIATRPQPLGHYWAVLGDYHFAAERPTQAFEALQTALRIDPYSFWGRYRMARLLEAREQTEDAIEQYEFILKYAYDRDAEIYIKLATLYRNSGREDRALEVLSTGIRIFPTNVPIYRLYREVMEAD